VLTIIAILSTIIAPNYNKILYRTKVAEILIAILPFKLEITEELLQSSQVSSAQHNIEHRVIDTIFIDASGLINVGVKARAFGIDGEPAIDFIPHFNSQGEVAWHCRPSGRPLFPAKYLPRECLQS